jgi:dTDP-4-dehydrorhamnose reductase
MKVVIIGASGVIGQAITKALWTNHEVVQVARSSGDYQVDITSKNSLAQLFEAVTPIDAVVCAAGAAKFAALETLSDEDFQFTLQNKLMQPMHNYWQVIYPF